MFHFTCGGATQVNGWGKGGRNVHRDKYAIEIIHVIGRFEFIIVYDNGASRLILRYNFKYPDQCLPVGAKRPVLSSI